MSEETSREAVARGRKEGRDDAKLEEHGARLDRINGSIDATKEALTALKAEVHRLGGDTERSLIKLEDDLSNKLDHLASDIRTLNEGQRLRDERVIVAADVLKSETERRREELASAAEVTDRGARQNQAAFSKWQALAALAIGTGLTVLGLALSQGWL